MQLDDLIDRLAALLHDCAQRKDLFVHLRSARQALQDRLVSAMSSGSVEDSSERLASAPKSTPTPMSTLLLQWRAQASVVEELLVVLSDFSQHLEDYDQVDTQMDHPDSGLSSTQENHLLVAVEMLVAWGLAPCYPPGVGVTGLNPDSLTTQLLGDAVYPGTPDDAFAWLSKCRSALERFLRALRAHPVLLTVHHTLEQRVASDLVTSALLTDHHLRARKVVQLKKESPSTPTPLPPFYPHRTQAYAVVHDLPVATSIEALMAVMSVDGAPRWLKHLSSLYLSLSLLRSDAVVAFLRLLAAREHAHDGAIHDEALLRHATHVLTTYPALLRRAQVAHLSADSFFSALLPQLLQVACPRSRALLPLRPVGYRAVVVLAGKAPRLAWRHLFTPMLGVLACSPPRECSSRELVVALERCRQLLEQGGADDATMTLLTPSVLPLVVDVYTAAKASGVEQQARVAAAIVTHFLQVARAELTVPLLREAVFIEAPRRTAAKQSVRVALDADSGRLRLVRRRGRWSPHGLLELEADQPANALLLVSEEKRLARSRELNDAAVGHVLGIVPPSAAVPFFMSLLRDLVQLPPSETYLQVLQVLLLGESLLSRVVLYDKTRVAEVIEQLLQPVVEERVGELRAMDANIVSLCLAMLGTLLGNDAKLDRADRELYSRIAELLRELGDAVPRFKDAAHVLRVTILTQYPSEERAAMRERAAAAAASDLSAYQEALHDLEHPEIPFRAAGLASLRKLVLAQDDEAMANLEHVFDLVQRQLHDPESFVYLGAVRAMVALSDAHLEQVLPRVLAKMREDTLPEDVRLKLAEAVSKIARHAGMTLAPIAGHLVNTAIALASQDSLTSVRMSALSLLSDVAALGVLAPGHIHDSLQLAAGVLVHERQRPDLQLAAVFLLRKAIAALGHEHARDVLSPEFLRDVSGKLAVVAEHAQDARVRSTAAAALHELDELGEQWLEQQVREVLGVGGLQGLSDWTPKIEMLE